MQRQQGFTLIELVIVLVLLGILAAVAVPRFIDLSAQAEESAVNAQAASISSASAINFAAAKAGSDDAAATAGESCEDAAGAILQTGFDTSRFTIEGTVPDNEGDAGTCTIGLVGNGFTAEATIIAVE